VTVVLGWWSVRCSEGIVHSLLEVSKLNCVNFSCLVMNVGCSA